MVIDEWGVFCVCSVFVCQKDFFSCVLWFGTAAVEKKERNQMKIIDTKTEKKTAREKKTKIRGTNSNRIKMKMK